MAEGRYQVSASAAVTEEFQRLLVVARDHGLLPLVPPAAKWIMSELARTPMEFGESREYLPHLQLHLRIAFAGPLTVLFAVHEVQRLVFIRGFRLSLPDDGPPS